MKISLLKSKELSVYLDKNICIIEFSNKETKNAISFDVAAHLAETSKKLPKLIKKENIGLILLRSSVAGVFVSGGDLKEISAFSKTKGARYTKNIREFCQFLSLCSVPTMSLLEGAAYGGGSEIALATDFRWDVSHLSSLHLWQSKFSVPGGWNGMQRLSDLAPHISPRKAGILFATASSFTASQLFEHHLLDACFNHHDEAIEASQKFAARFVDCEYDLRVTLLARKNAGKKYDEKLFAKFFLSSKHLQKVKEFLQRGR